MMCRLPTSASAESVLWDENGTLVAYATQMMLFTYLPD